MVWLVKPSIFLLIPWNFLINFSYHECSCLHILELIASILLKIWILGGTILIIIKHRHCHHNSVVQHFRKMYGFGYFNWFVPPLLYYACPVPSYWIAVHIQTRSLMPCSVATTPPRAMGPSLLTSRASSLLSLSLLLLLSQTSLASPLPDLCGGLYDCTSTENSLLTHFARLPDISACRARCQEDARCEYFTFNYQPAEQSLYPGACFLLTSCSSRRPGASQWVSGARDCAVLPAPPTLARHFRELAVLVRTQ